MSELTKLLKKARHIRVQTEFGSAVKVSKVECGQWLESLERRNIVPTYETAPLHNGILVIFRKM